MKKVFIIAELSANHNHSIENAIATIRAAKRVGADAIKIQTYTQDTMTIDCKKDDFKIQHGTAWDGQYLYDFLMCSHTPVCQEAKVCKFASPPAVAASERKYRHCHARTVPIESTSENCSVLSGGFIASFREYTVIAIFPEVYMRRRRVEDDELKLKAIGQTTVIHVHPPTANTNPLHSHRLLPATKRGTRTDDTDIQCLDYRLVINDKG